MKAAAASLKEHSSTSDVRPSAADECLHSIRRRRFIVARLKPLSLFVFFLLAFYFALGISSNGFDLMLPLNVVLGEASRAQEVIFYNIRLPRTTTAAVVGACLALAGAVMQNVLRNPLASASTLGVSQGAAFGAALAIVFFHAGLGADGNLGAAVSVTSPVVVSVFSFVFGVASGCVVLLLSLLTRISSASMILAGIAMGAMFTGGTALIQYFADDVKVASIVYWTFGDVGRTGWSQIGSLAAALLAAFAYFYRNAWNYNAIDNGSSTAISLGVNVNIVLTAGMFAASLLSSFAVAFVGTIGFVGLIAPHVARRYAGNDHRQLLISSIFTGAILLIGAEVLSRTAAAPTVLPIGAITSFLGAPAFLYMIFKSDGWKKW